MKRIICIMLSVLLCVLMLPVPAAAASYYPTLTNIVRYDEFPYGEDVTITWNAPTAGTVTNYLISLRHLKDANLFVDDLMIQQESLSASRRSYTIPGDTLGSNCLYRVALAAVNSNGSSYWVEQLFYVSVNRGVHNRTISLKIHTGLPLYFKEAIYYSTRTWINATGYERVNTYSYSNGVESSALVSGDGISTVIPGVDHASTALMRTYPKLDDYNNLIEADIVIFYGRDWDFGSGGTYDVQSSMTHEIGHVLGLCDKYESDTAEWTMYGHGLENSLAQRTLHSQDLQRLTRLYD